MKSYCFRKIPKKINWLLMTVFLLFFVSCGGSIEDNSTDASIQTEFLNLSYGNHERNTLDISLPKERSKENTKTMIFIHGGGWVSGSKEEFAQWREYYSNIGFAAVSLNYRYANGNDVTFPQIIQDIDNAIKFIKKNADNWHISDNFGLLGISAGGHLSLLYGYTFENVKLIISIVGPVDLSDELLHEYLKNQNDGYDALPIITGNCANCEYNASPVNFIKNIPTLLIYGKLDDLVPYQQGETLFNLLKENDFTARYILVENAGHNVFGENGENTTILVQYINDWIIKYLK